MALLTTGIDMGGVPEGMRRLVEADLPFTIVTFLNKQATGGQEAAQAKERGTFKLRNDWTVRNTKIKRATKQTLTSEVFTDTANRKTGAPDYLPRQDYGEERVPLAGHHFLAIPTKYLRKIAPGIIPAALRPRQLLPPDARIDGPEYTGRFGRVGKASTPHPRTKRQHDALSAGQYVAFVQRTKSRALCIFVRHGGISYHGGTKDAEPWYVLVRAAHIKGRFPMEQIVKMVVERDAEANFTRRRCRGDGEQSAPQWVPCDLLNQRHFARDLVRLAKRDAEFTVSPYRLIRAAMLKVGLFVGGLVA